MAKECKKGEQHLIYLPTHTRPLTCLSLEMWRGCCWLRWKCLPDPLSVVTKVWAPECWSRARNPSNRWKKALNGYRASDNRTFRLHVNCFPPQFLLHSLRPLLPPFFIAHHHHQQQNRIVKFLSACFSVLFVVMKRKRKSSRHDETATWMKPSWIVEVGAIRMKDGI